MERLLEIRTYRLRPGLTAEFDRRVERVMPLLAAHAIDVVGYGPSVVDDEGEHYVLLRSFASHDERDAQEARFYGSDEWRSGPRDSILECIDAYHTVVLPMSDDALGALRAAMRRPDGKARPRTRDEGE